jgi:HD-like signal output (HDOD) protein
MVPEGERVECQVRAGEEFCGKTLCGVPVFHPVAVKLMGVLAQEDVSIAEVAALLNSDPAFGAEVLTMANSAAYGSSQRILTIERAITTIGIERTRTLAATAALAGIMPRGSRSRAVESCWVHSRATAMAAKWLAPLYHLHPERAYTAGLMHDIGRLGLLSVEPLEYARLLSGTAGTLEDMLLAERWAFRFDHCQAGLFLTRTWGLPVELQQAASEHHGTPAAGAGNEVVRMACGLAHAFGYKAAPQVEGGNPSELIMEVPDLARSRPGDPAAVLAGFLNSELAGF